MNDIELSDSKESKDEKTNKINPVFLFFIISIFFFSNIQFLNLGRKK